MCYNVFTIKINLFKYIKDAKMEGIQNKNTGSSHLKGDHSRKIFTGPAEQPSKCGGRSTSFEV